MEYCFLPWGVLHLPTESIASPHGEYPLSPGEYCLSNLGRSVTSIFVLMDHFLYRVSTFSEKVKKTYRLEDLIVLQNAPSNSDLFSSSFICAAVSNAKPTSVH